MPPKIHSRCCIRSFLLYFIYSPIFVWWEEERKLKEYISTYLFVVLSIIIMMMVIIKGSIWPLWSQFRDSCCRNGPISTRCYRGFILSSHMQYMIGIWEAYIFSNPLFFIWQLACEELTYFTSVPNEKLANLNDGEVTMWWLVFNQQIQ